MSKIMCPGQDTRYWRPGDIFDVACGDCGNSLEFFKDEASRRCPKCGNRVQNPKLSMGCAQWCEHAKECLGFDPKLVDNNGKEAGYDMTLTGKLVDAVKYEFGENNSIFANAIQALKEAEQLLKNEDEISPRIVIAAVLLAEADINPGSAEKAAQGTGSNAEKCLVAEKIMKDVGLDKYSIEEICDIIKNYHSRDNIDSPEFRIVSSALHQKEHEENLKLN